MVWCQTNTCREVSIYWEDIPGNPTSRVISFLCQKKIWLSKIFKDPRRWRLLKAVCRLPRRLQARTMRHVVGAHWGRCRAGTQDLPQARLLNVGRGKHGLALAHSACEHNEVVPCNSGTRNTRRCSMWQMAMPRQHLLLIC